jgi:hypothetical protein
MAAGRRSKPPGFSAGAPLLRATTVRRCLEDCFTHCQQIVRNPEGIVSLGVDDPGMRVAN